MQGRASPKDHELLTGWADCLQKSMNRRPAGRANPSKTGHKTVLPGFGELAERQLDQDVPGVQRSESRWLATWSQIAAFVICMLRAHLPREK